MIQNSNISAKCSAGCVLPCNELQYEAATSLVPWPRSSLLSAYSYTYLSNPRFRYLLNLTANATQDEIHNATQTSAAAFLLQSRFLQLKYQFGAQSFIELKDVAAFSVDAMGAQIGGVLSLWLGVTVMFAFEAFEFFYTYLTNCHKKEPSPQARGASVGPAMEIQSSGSVIVQEE